ncbi:MAG: TonB-dependent receptor domain-containing protein, partial [Candidatus Bathyarchaeia archaeon]
MRYGGQFIYMQDNRAYGASNQALELLGFDPASGLDAMLTGNLAYYDVAVNPQGLSLPCYNDPTNGPVIVPGCLLNLPVSAPNFSRSYRYRDFAVYAQDNWRATERLTLNYGLRWEFYGVQHNNNQALDSNFYYGAGSNLYQMVQNGSVMTAPDSPVGGMWHPNYGNFAPRIGFAYDLFGDGKTSLRGGAGISYERNFGNITFNAIQNPPGYATVALSSTSTPTPVVSVNNYGPLAGTSGTTPFLAPSLRQIDQNIKTAQTQFYSMALERRLARNMIVALEYSGAHGIHLYDIQAENALGAGNVYLGDAYDPALGNYSRPNNYYSDINTRSSGGTSRYNGLNIRVQAQNLHDTGLGFVVNYTWSHSMDDLSSTFSSITA